MIVAASHSCTPVPRAPSLPRRRRRGKRQTSPSVCTYRAKARGWKAAVQLTVHHVDARHSAPGDVWVNHLPLPKSFIVNGNWIPTNDWVAADVCAATPAAPRLPSLWCDSVIQSSQRKIYARENIYLGYKQQQVSVLAPGAPVLARPRSANCTLKKGLSCGWTCIAARTCSCDMLETLFEITCVIGTAMCHSRMHT